MKLYFAYGSNLWRKQMEDRCPQHRVIGNGILKGYRWIITSKGYANIIQSETDEVYGVIYEISESDEHTLDYWEIEKAGYRKETVEVEFEEQTLKCLVYVDSNEEEGQPKKEYMERIMKGLSDSNLPKEYMDRYIRKFISPIG